jgi:isocitrate/isopropylmalate dehydrogenase
VDTKIWRPSLQKSQNEHPEIKKNENEKFQMAFQAALQTYQKCQSLYKSNTIKAYALFWGRCTKRMRNKIEARTNYYTKIKNNPIKLVKAIK